MTFNASPDYETKSSYSFNVVASDGTLTSSQAVTLSVTDVAPAITSATSVTVPEGTSTATVVYTAAATDVQGGAVTFSLTGADASAFTIDPATGAVTFNASPDFETQSSYTFNVVASDGTLTSAQAVTLAVSDVAPVITSSSSVNVPEGASTATVVYTAAATDVQGGAVTFSLTGADASAFTIDPATGAVTFNASPDFETQSAYAFDVIASDGTLVSTQAVSLNVTNVAPTITSATSVSVPEGTSAATVIYAAAATDPAGGAVSFTLTGADAGAFTIDPATGAVTFNASPDFETQSSYGFNVVASDGTTTSAQAVTVGVTDVAPAITSGTSVSVPEGLSTATVVYTAAANDVQGGGVTFGLTGADAAAFTIDPATGAVTFNASPDYETKSSYTFNVVASDGTLASAQAVTVAVTDVAPTITSATSVTVPEGTSTATVVYTAAATDVQGGAVTFGLTGADAGAFTIDPATGAVTFNASPSFETKSAYAFNVVASDGTLTSSQAVTVAITDIAPTITSATSVSVSEGISTTTTVYTAAATDPAGGAVTFSLTGADAAAFTIDSMGRVTFNASPDFETKTSYSFNVVASDGTLTSSQAVTVNVTDVAPTITSATSVSVPDGTSTSTAVYTAAGNDPAGGTVTFSLTGADAAAFTINPATGAVTFNAVPDYATKSSYAFNVVASDGTVTSLQAVTVAVTQAQSSQPGAQPPTAILHAWTPPVPQPSGAAPLPVPDTLLAGPRLGLLALGLPVDRTVDPANLGGNAGPSIAERATSLPDLNALPPTAAGPSDLPGFPVERVGLDVALQARDGAGFDGLFTGGHRLFVYHGIPDMQVTGDGAGSLKVPQDAFAHTDPSAVVHLEARLIDGLPLPSWLKFEGLGGTFRGLPPEGLRGTLEIEVVARDTEGREARTRFALEVETLRSAAARQADIPDLMLGLDVDAKEAEKVRLEAARQAAESRNPAGPRPGAPGKPQREPAALFSDQVRTAKAARDPLLDRIARSGPDTPASRR